MRFGAIVLCANEWRFVPAVVGQLKKYIDRVLIVRNRNALSGSPINLNPLPKTGIEGASLYVGSWSSEHEARNAGIEQLMRDGYDYIFIVDSDEIFSDHALFFLKDYCAREHPRAIRGGCCTYWKTSEWVIDPPEQLAVPVVVRNDVRFSYLRMVGEATTITESRLFHHLSYVRTDEEMREKLRCFGHASEVIPGWYQRVWKGWDVNRALENLHPTHPAAFKRAVPSDGVVKKTLSLYGCT